MDGAAGDFVQAECEAETAMSEYCTCETSFDGSCQLHDRIDALTAENAALRKDAEQRNKAIQRLMARLADLLQDDDFNTLERWVLEAGFTYPPIDAAMEQSHE